jgi:hypothetical protein
LIRAWRERSRFIVQGSKFWVHSSRFKVQGSKFTAIIGHGYIQTI